MAWKISRLLSFTSMETITDSLLESIKTLDFQTIRKCVIGILSAEAFIGLLSRAEVIVGAII